MNKAVYEKTLENVGKHRDFELVSKDCKFRRLVSSTRLKCILRLTHDLGQVSLRHASIVLNRLVFVGFTVLDVSIKR